MEQKHSNGRLRSDGNWQTGKSASLSGLLDGGLAAAALWGTDNVLSLPFVCRWMLERQDGVSFAGEHDNACQSGVRKRICVRERIGRRYKI